ncbi:MAG: hypothetical protein K9M02_05275 [Thiohalocapsa sp.]|jgi:hypothetical protein|nr:hypothetical protein [Thiohalocapsa sp.]
MNRHVAAVMMLIGLSTAPAMAQAERLQTAIGGAVGGGLGALIGNELGGRGGAILGGALGAAVASAMTTGGADNRGPRYSDRWRDFDYYDAVDADRRRWR